MDIAQESQSTRGIAPIFLFAATLFISATLMFLLQPMFGKVLLPLLGGAPSVWNTCMVFFQTVLFFGYLYAHFICKVQQGFRQILIHGVVIAVSCLALPVALSESAEPPNEADPTLWLIKILSVSIGLPFFVLSTTAPLLQKWFSRIGHQTSNDPYYLYVASNAGSLLALLSYPFLLEPNIGLIEQQITWSSGFSILCFLLICCMLIVLRAINRAEVSVGHRDKMKDSPDLFKRLHWLILSFVPSSLLLGLNNYITTDIASVPLLWVIPLSLYLLSFIIVFSKFNVSVQKWMVALQPLIIPPFVVYLSFEQVFSHITIELILNLLAFFLSVMVCHGELAKKRPNTQYLTTYYLIMSFGGMLGGMFNTFLAPLLFDTIFEYPLMLVAALMLRPHQMIHAEIKPDYKVKLLVFYILLFAFVIYYNGNNLSQNLIVTLTIITMAAINYLAFRNLAPNLLLNTIVIIACLASFNDHEYKVLHQERTFFGVLNVREREVHNDSKKITTLHEFYNGTTKHGAQIVASDQQCAPIGYYHPRGPIGQLFDAYDQVNENWDIGIVGLGSGVMGSYAKKAQSWTFYELDPSIVDLALNQEYFTFLHNCVESPEIYVGDARLTLDRKKEPQFDLLVMDAFSSDSVPTHLLTKEALELYLANLKSSGLLVFHITNRHLTLKKVVANHARNMGLAALHQVFLPQKNTPFIHYTEWIVLAKDATNLKPLMLTRLGSWNKLPEFPEIRDWTDDFTSIINILK